MKNLFQTKDNFLNKKISNTLLIMLIYLLGLNIPLPFVEMTKSTVSASEDLMFFVNAGSNSGGSIFALGLAPWMISMIIWRVTTELFRDSIGKIPQKRQYKYQMLLVLFLAIIFSFFQSFSFELNTASIEGLLSVEMAKLALIIVMIAGTYLLIWFGNILSENGIGGISSIVVVNMLLNLTRQFSQVLDNHDWNIKLIAILIIFSILLTIIIVISEKAELRVGIQQTVMYNAYAEKLYIPFKLNSAGAMAVMYGLTLFSFLSMLIQLLGEFEFIKGIPEVLLSDLNLDNGFGISVYAVILVLLAYLFTSMNVSGSLLAKNMHKQGDYIDAVAFGSETRKYLNKRIRFISFVGVSLTLLVGAVPFWASLYYPGLKEFAQLPSSIMVLIIIVLNVLMQLKHLNLRSVYKDVDILGERGVK